MAHTPGNGNATGNGSSANADANNSTNTGIKTGIGSRPQPRYWARTRRLTAILFLCWLSLTFGVVFFARELSGYAVFGWPFSYYMVAQGTTLLYLLIVGLYAWRMNCLDNRFRREAEAEAEAKATARPAARAKGRHAG